MAKNKNIALRWFKILTDTVAPGANLGFVDYLEDLSVQIDGLSSADGMVAKVKSIEIIFASQSVTFHAIQNFILQCSSAPADTVNLAEQSVHQLLDAATGDDFGHINCGPVLQSKITHGIYNVQATQWGTFFKFKVPQNLIEIINKDSQNERDQNLYTGILGRTETNATVYIYCTIAVDYVLEAKRATLR
jgi:hypothetical protein